MVVLGHWLLTGTTHQGGHLSGLDALDYVSWGRWVTLLFQVMPVFFLVGGHANAVSWTAHQQRGEGCTEWVRGRALRLLWPSSCPPSPWPGPPARILPNWPKPTGSCLVPVVPAGLPAADRADPAAGRAPAVGTGHPVVMAAGAAGVDACVLGPHLHLIGFADYLLVWGTMHQ